MSLETIKTSVFTYIGSVTGLPPILFDNVEADIPTVNHFKLYVLPATTRTLGLTTLNQEIGIIQASIFVKKNEGDIEGARLAQLLLDAFPRNLELTGLRIDEAGSIGPSFYDGAWQITPASINYQNLC